MLAHIRETDQTEQTLKEHSVNTAAIAAENLKRIGLYSFGYFVGLHHDMGKAIEPFQTYLRKSVLNAGEYVKKAPPHAPAGAIWVYERYFAGDDQNRKCAAQIAAMAILGHHGGLADCLDTNCEYRSPFLKSIHWDKDEIHYDEAVSNFGREVAACDESDALFDKACAELEAFLSRAPKDIKSFCISMTARLILGALTDADRHDTACLERGVDSLVKEPTPEWSKWTNNLEKRMSRFKADSKISKIRAAISQACREAGKQCGAGIYRLTVPTGGGKTLSSALFAAWQGLLTDRERLIYVAPFNTILDQNAEVLREAFGEDELLLEHHADVVIDEDDDVQVKRHRTLTERWTSRIILTSMVQLMNTLFKYKNTNARRLPRLANSIIIFDEIQALPRKLTVLFECAVRFMTDCLGCTAVLCTATQPTLRAHVTDVYSITAENLESKPPLGAELIPEVDALFDELRRVCFVDERDKPRTNEQAGAELAAMLNAGNSVLMVVNTKRTAREVYSALMSANPPQGAVCVHLTTDMCAAHRKQAIDAMTEALNRKKADPSAPCVCCISTALIEAGVDISFPIVVRSMAGLPSILQAAGRCNRNGEAERGTVYIWRMSEEKLSNGLAEISHGQQDSEGILDKAAREGHCIDKPEMISAYFHQQLHNDNDRLAELFYPFGEKSSRRYITRLLGKNTSMLKAVLYYEQNPLEHMTYYGNWRTAGEQFNVIDEDTTAVAVPYGEGKEIITELNSLSSYENEKKLIKKVQKYCVSVRSSVFKELKEARAVWLLGETGVWALREEFYDNETGLTRQGKPMEFLIK